MLEPFERGCSVRNKYLGMFVLLGSMSTLFATSARADGEQKAPETKKKIRWVLAHEPVDVFRRAAGAFSEQLSKASQGKLEVEVLTVNEYSGKYGGGTFRQEDVIAYVSDGRIEMSQSYVSDLGRYNKDMLALELPYIFKSHDHAKKVLEGEVGGQLLAGLSTGNLKGLAFTYSGGYRILPATKPVRKLEDFKGLRIRTSNNPVAMDTLRALGAQPVPMSLNDVPQAFQNGKIDAAESTYVRFYSMKQNRPGTVVNDTQHSLFLTSIVLNKTFWNGLTPAEQDMVRDAALVAARTERQESIDDIAITRGRCEKEGIQVVDLPESEKARIRQATAPLLLKYEKRFSAGLINKLQAE